jgi:hypothetical protein
MESHADIEQSAAGSSKEAPEKRRAPPHLIRKTPPEQGDRRYGRSRITNGTALLPGIDGRSPWVRRCKDIIASHLSDLGGPDNTSAAERSLVRRASVLTVELERLEAKFAAANEASDTDLDLYQRTAGNLRRLLEAVGIARRPRDIGPSLGDLLREDFERQQQEASAR